MGVTNSSSRLAATVQTMSPAQMSRTLLASRQAREIMNAQLEAMP